MGELERRPNAWALTPLVVFLLTYLVVSIVAGDFYKMPITVAFVISSIVAIAISKGGKLSNRIEQFCRGAANSNIMLMVLIFILAGAFAQTAKAMGAVDATVNLAMSILPGNLLAAGIFLAACFISISVGTSVGTIVALAPVAVGIADKTGMPDALMLGVVVSGAMFGDNLSFISDTTIVATRTQGCQMSDKFKVNIRIALPIAILTGLIYVLVGSGVENAYAPAPIEWVKVIPYLVVLVTAVCGINVMLVLFIGIVLSGIVGLWTGSFDIWGWNASMGLGITNMGELIIVTLLAGGMLEMIRYNGRLDHPQAYLPHPFLQGGRDEHSGLGKFRQPLHGQQYDRPHHGRPDRQGYSGPVQDRSPPQRQPIGYLLLLRTGNHPLRRPDVDGRRTRACLPYRDHAISLLPVSIGGRRLIGDLIQLPEEIYGKLNG